MLKRSILVATIFMLMGFTTFDKSREFDFDHGIHFEQKMLEDGRYHIVVQAKDDIRFNRLATFLLRKSYSLCQSYGFKIEVLNGVEEFDDSIARPNLIIPSLSANVECPSK